MSDWIKVLVSAVAGMLTGIAGALLLEPLKQTIVQHYNVRHVRKKIYYDLGRILAMTNRAMTYTEEHILQIPKFYVLTETEMDAFDFYFETKREIFYMLPECIGLEFLCGGIKELRTLLKEGDSTAAEALERISEQFRFARLTQKIDWRLLDKMATLESRKDRREANENQELLKAMNEHQEKLYEAAKKAKANKKTAGQ